MEEKIGYVFKNKDILNRALTHSSYSNEMKEITENNENLEWLGDSFFHIAATIDIFKTETESNEGEMTKKRAKRICNDTLSKIAQKLDVQRYLKIGQGAEVTGVRHNNKVLASTLESIVGAVYLDNNNANDTINVCHKLLSLAEQEDSIVDYISTYQEIYQKKYKKSPVYDIVSSDKGFTAILICDSFTYEGFGRTKQIAKQNAAKEALKKYNN
jgi:ribonuclease-3